VARVDAQLKLCSSTVAPGVIAFSALLYAGCMVIVRLWKSCATILIPANAYGENALAPAKHRNFGNGRLESSKENAIKK